MYLENLPSVQPASAPAVVLTPPADNEETSTVSHLVETPRSKWRFLQPQSDFYTWLSAGLWISIGAIGTYLTLFVHIAFVLVLLLAVFVLSNVLVNPKSLETGHFGAPVIRGAMPTEFTNISLYTKSPEIFADIKEKKHEFSEPVIVQDYGSLRSCVIDLTPVHVPIRTLIEHATPIPIAAH